MEDLKTRDNLQDEVLVGRECQSKLKERRLEIVDYEIDYSNSEQRPMAGSVNKIVNIRIPLKLRKFVTS
jgi:hypothetical protein